MVLCFISPTGTLLPHLYRPDGHTAAVVLGPGRVELVQACAGKLADLT